METTIPQKRIWFPEWAIVLQRSVPTPAQRESYRLAIVRYLHHCKTTKTPVTVASARQFVQNRLHEDQTDSTQLCAYKEALNWFFREAQQYRQHRARDIPPLARADLGKTDWERRLIRHLRGNHYRLRTEQAYRGWAARFATWLEHHGSHGGPASRRPEEATEDDVRAFLSALATEQRSSASTQKQALNAIVFLLRDVYGRQLGDFSNFERARKPRRIPVVLSRDECQRLFSALDGTLQLMAELMYGSGLRLTELLGLRIKDIDLERQQLVVRGGKGDKDRVLTRLSAFGYQPSA